MEVEKLTRKVSSKEELEQTGVDIGEFADLNDFRTASKTLCEWSQRRAPAKGPGEGSFPAPVLRLKNSHRKFRGDGLDWHTSVSHPVAAFLGPPRPCSATSAMHR